MPERKLKRRSDTFDAKRAAATTERTLTRRAKRDKDKAAVAIPELQITPLKKFHLRSPYDIRILLKKIMNRLYNGTIEKSTANSIAYVANIALKSMDLHFQQTELREMAVKLEELEAQKYGADR